MKEVQKSSCASRIALIRCPPSEPLLDALTDINELCLESDFVLILCWSDMEAAQYLQAVGSACATSIDFVRAPKESAGPMPTFIDALTTLPSVRRNDAVRIGNEFGTPAAALLATAEDLGKIAGVGPKKSALLRRVFDAPLPVTQRTLEEVLETVENSRRAGLGRAAASATPSDALNAALAHADALEEADDVGHLSPPKIS